MKGEFEHQSVSFVSCFLSNYLLDKKHETNLTDWAIKVLDGLGHLRDSTAKYSVPLSLFIGFL